MGQDVLAYSIFLRWYDKCAWVEGMRELWVPHTPYPPWPNLHSFSSTNAVTSGAQRLLSIIRNY